MSVRLRNTLLFLMLLLIARSNAQESNRRSYGLSASGDTLTLDTLSIYPNSFELLCDDIPLSREDYFLDFAASRLKVHVPCENITVTYRVLPFNLSKTLALRDTALIYESNKGIRDAFLISGTDPVEDIFGGSALHRAGSISRGVTFGNNQDLGINSTLNLELSGQIAPNLHLLASVSDDNLPIQADGNTNKLKEFDQIFIQIYNDRFKMIAGDFWLHKPSGYFMTYKKRSQGLTIENTWNTDTTKLFKTQVSGAMSRGKFNRQIIPGVEGNQGPYRLRGAENEPFIIILAGTERVYIDGRLLERGQEFDYVIDYNMAELTFTSRNQITKDVRIVVEFQYSDQNYIRSLFQTATTFENKKLKYWFNAYSEQDAKNQSIQQDLSAEQKMLLSTIGDSLDLARYSSIDSVGFLENQNLYKMVDSLGYDSVLVYSVHPDSAVFRATFEFVGAGNGDYVLENYNALGKVYRWVAPVSGVNQGDYRASRVIITPKQRQMVSTGILAKLTDKLSLETEIAYTKNDLNTFSPYDSRDDNSLGTFLKLKGDLPLSKDSIPKWTLQPKVSLEARERNFNPIEQYRSVEFDRDWNTRNKSYRGNELASTLGTNFVNTHGNINVEGQQYLIGTDYQGYRGKTNGTWDQKGFQAIWDGSYLSSASESRNEFIRHKIDVSQQIGWFKFGFQDDQEQNSFRTSYLEQSSYSFFDYQFYVANSDSLKQQFKLFYRERYDKRSDSTALTPAAKARSIGGELSTSELKNQKLTLLASLRELRILDSTLINNVPENTLVGRLEYQLKAIKGLIDLSTFYEIGSGLELKREFLYLQVNDGQGIYTWIDYNGDGIKDLNEFELAQFADQASYIRVFTPSNEYIKTYSTEYNQSIYIRPERIWSNKQGIRSFLARFSDQARFRMSRKTDNFTADESLNPFNLQINDSNLIAINSTLRNTLYFNRTSNIFGMEYTYQQVGSKSLLASGFDARSNAFNELVIRWNIRRSITFKVTGTSGQKTTNADYTAGRNFNIVYTELEPSFIVQPSTKLRVSLDGRYAAKDNNKYLGDESTEIYELGTSLKYNQAEKGSLQGNFKILSITYDGVENSALGFEMLESLRPGTNYTWELSYQRSISKSLQLSIQYNGRKSPENRMIHTGGMELRAFF